jgi:prepilin-type N-terminal cleavage/methylation domain-containing protein
MTGMASMRCRRGFTLIEIVIALALAGLLASLAGPMLSGAIKGTSKTMSNLSDAITLQTQMDKIVSCCLGLADRTKQDIINCSTVSSGYSIVSEKTGLCVVSGSNVSVDNTAVGSLLYAVTVKSNTTGERLTTLFAITK